MRIPVKIIIAGAAVLMAIAAGCSGKKGHDVAIYEEMRSADKMVFASMSITKMARTESSEWYKIGKRIAVYSYDSYMRAYIDMSELKPGDIDCDDKAKSVHVTLPAVKTEVTGRDMEMKKEYENIGLLRSELDSKERAEIKEAANRSFRKEVSENPRFRKILEESARKRARKYFETLIAANGYTACIDFKDTE